MGKILLVLVLIGAIVYALFWLIEQRRVGRGGGGSGQVSRPQRPSPGGTPRVTGPDDDPAFLREIERRRRQAERDAEQKGDGSGGPEPA